MECSDLIAAARLRLDDRLEPYLCGDDDLIAHAAEGEKEAAIRAGLLYDDDSAFLTYTLADGVDRYALDPRVWHIDRAWLMLTGRTRETPLELTGIDRLHAQPQSCGCWPTEGRPQACAQVGNTVRLWPTPRATDTGTLHLAVYRTPLSPIETTQDEPEVAEVHQIGIVDWMLYRAFGNKDEELYDPGRSEQALNRFTERFGERQDAKTHRRHNERRRVTARYGGF